jgi:hypothetical protein
MKNQLQKAGSGILFCLLILSLMMANINLNAQAKKTDFSGIWSINEGKSNFGEGGSRKTMKMTIEQKDNTLSIERLSKNQQGEESTSVEKLTLDGKECINTINERQKKSTVTPAADGSGLTITATITFDRDGQTMEINSVETWKQGENANTLLVDYHSKSARGERQQSLVYDKAK